MHTVYGSGASQLQEYVIPTCNYRMGQSKMGVAAVRIGECACTHVCVHACVSVYACVCPVVLYMGSVDGQLCLLYWQHHCTAHTCG